MFGRSRTRLRLDGVIAGAGFSSGDRFVVGLWDQGPLGPMADVMWARPNGTRILLADSAGTARFVGGVYSFDEVQVVPFDIRHAGEHGLDLRAGGVELELAAGPARRLFGLRPRWLRRWTGWVRVENALFRALVGRFVLEGSAGVRTYGVSLSGVKEWYCIDAYRPVEWGCGTIDGTDLGALGPLEPPVEFGFSEFPRAPALVRCAPVLEGADRYLPPNAPEGASPV